MKTSFISTLTLWNAPRSGVARMQTDLASALTELNSSRFADVGLELGYRTGTSLDLHRQLAELDAQKERNGLASLRLSGTQTILDQVREDGEGFLALVAPGKLSDDSAAAITQEASSRLAALTAQLNGAAGGQYLFAGIDTGKKPVTIYEGTPASAAKTAMATAFQAAFGTSQGTQPGAAAITPAQMTAFLDGPFTALFTDATWSANWSSASNRNITSRISGSETVETSVNANAGALRQLAMAYTLGSDIGLSSLSKPTQDAVYTKIRDLMGTAAAGVTSFQADLGRAQTKTTEATTRIDIQKVVLTKSLEDLEGTDPAEVKTRIDTLKTQIEMSYSVTSQIRGLSLINFI
ncbi:flagellar hook-associated family protein [Methylobacterium sp. 1030]|uniref:flagellar hook-associated family protein n=1 Tax=Methylobacterium sp. 1030 TaxID=3156404 RepID=UPI0033992A22